ncbi:hypothetical protein GFS31_36260 [Leptolyngbya sp. BL0902]|uniref:DUF1997 domain-containing protein n=1 Tax=Leptolyngbya sp. BL0902 TaxID=1115757 RepID=UPI0019369CDB|nr:DUF1997 domain-containing protein [Leptolyngbya sp. BL0902]QQE66921.1 hypothetical protein GFS31_36260 [Leptolyngbya sp. BL0902]
MSFSPETCGPFWMGAADVVGDAPTGMALDPQAKSQSADPGPEETLLFEGRYAGQMDMAADVGTVGQYLNGHRCWFPRCAHPMQVSPISDHGYALVVGRFSVLGYEVEPQVGLYLSPLDHGIYRIDTMPIPGYVPPGYDVNFQSVLTLREEHPQGAPLTQVDWTLTLTVGIHKPRFLNALPQALVKASGDKLLNQVVRQVSKRLTRKVQEDFHHTRCLPLPESYHRHHFWSHWGKTPNRQDVET